MKVINKTARIICLGEHSLIPMQETEIPAEAGKHPRIKELIKDGDIELVKPAKVAETPESEDK